MIIMNKAELIEDFKSHLVTSMNEDVYYQLKSWLEMIDIDDDEYVETLDYMCDNLHGSLEWVE